MKRIYLNKTKHNFDYHAQNNKANCDTYRA